MKYYVWYYTQIIGTILFHGKKLCEYRAEEANWGFAIKSNIKMSRCPICKIRAAVRSEQSRGEDLPSSSEFRMASENGQRMVQANAFRDESVNPVAEHQSQLAKLKEDWRRQCGCLRTSDKLKEILKTFPSPPPPSPTYEKNGNPLPEQNQNSCQNPTPGRQLTKPLNESESSKVSSKSMLIVYELVQLVQLSVTATALALYYLIYCYMQLVYYTLRSALYFHHADGPMKITIGVVTVTSLIVGFNLLIRMEKIIGIF